MKIKVNDVELYYEVAGSGSPLILVHGNGESHEIFDAAAEVLSKHFTCYLLDSRGHGQSQKVSTFHYADMAEDIYQFIQALSLQNITFYGFSDGGIIGLLLASKYPDLFERMIISGANTSPAAISGWVEEAFPDWRRIMKKSPLFKLMMTEPDITREKLAAIQIPTLVLAGSEDVIDEKDTRFIAESIPGATLQILQGEDHDSYIVGSTKVAELILEFCEVKTCETP